VKINSKYKLDTIASKDTTREHFCDPYLDAEAEKLVATDGHRLIVVPVELEADTSGFIARDVLAEGRKLAKKARLAEVVLEGKQKLSNGAVFPTNQERHFPPWRAAVPDFQPGDKGTLTVGLDVRYLKELADALGCKDGAVVITIRLPPKGADALDPILVQALAPREKTTLTDYRDPDAFAVLMPMRVTGLKEGSK